MFIHDYTIANHNQPHQHHRLLVRYKLNSEQKYISIIDNTDNDSSSDNDNDNDSDSDSFPQQRFFVTAPRTLSLLRYELAVGSSRGLLCFYGLNGEPRYERTQMAVLWNPFIRKCVGVVIPNALRRSGYTVIGFGVCPKTSDPKLVKVNHHIDSEFEPVTWEVEIFTLSSGYWRSIFIKMPRMPIYLKCGQVVIDGVIYWKAYDKHPFLVKLRQNRIISFDLTSEEFGEVFLSDHLLTTTNRLVVSKLMGSLVVIEDCIEDGELVCVVWKLEHNVPKSFKKLFTMKPPNDAMLIKVLSFFKNGEPIVRMEDGNEDSTTFHVYEPNSGRFKDFGIFGNNGGLVTSCTVTSYRETLLLLDKPDSIIH